MRSRSLSLILGLLEVKLQGYPERFLVGAAVSRPIEGGLFMFLGTMPTATIAELHPASGCSMPACNQNCSTTRIRL